jgi:anti-sigma factor ChrR (cupin superfamily)
MGNTLRERKMYQDFVSYARARAPPATLDEPDDSSADPEQLAAELGIDAKAAVEEALEYFGRRDEWYSIAESVSKRKRLKEKLNGKLVEQTTALKGVVIRDILAAVKEKASEDELLSMEQEEIQGLVRKVAADMR